jgi:predicted transcriptional regulator of viral defense system
VALEYAHSEAKTVPPDLAVAGLAAEQDGVIHSEQLRECGLGRRAIHYRASNGRFHQLFPRVYAVGHPTISRKGWLRAAILYSGPDSVLSHWTAAEVHGLTRGSRRAIHVTIPGRNGFVLGDLRAHRTRRLEPADTAVVDGLRVTSVPRTLVDVAGVARANELLSTMEQAQRLGVFDLRRIEALLGHSNGRRGAAALRAALNELRDEPPDAKSRLERRFLAYCRRRRLPEPALNVSVAGFMVDAAWPGRGVVGELDSYSYHGHKRSFESDRKRDIKLQIAGQRVVRITYWRLTREAGELEQELRFLLGC